MIQLSCIDEVQRLSHWHRALIRSSFSIPGFDPEVSRRELYPDDRGWQKPYSVHIPYIHRRFWPCLVSAPPGQAVTNPKSNAVVAYKATRLVGTALARHRLGSPSVHSRLFARRVSHSAKRHDEAWKDFGTTSSVRFALRFVIDTRRRYFSAQKSLLPPYADSNGMVAEGHAYRKAQEAADARMAVVDADEEAVAAGVFVDPQVEDRYWPESDRDEEVETLRARSWPSRRVMRRWRGHEVVVVRRDMLLERLANASDVRHGREPSGLEGDRVSGGSKG